MLLNSDSTVESQYSRDKCWLERKVCFIQLASNLGRRRTRFPKNQLDHESFLMEKREVKHLRGWGCDFQSLHYLPLCADFLLIRCRWGNRNLMLTLPLKLLAETLQGTQAFWVLAVWTPMWCPAQTLYFPSPQSRVTRLVCCAVGKGTPVWLGNNTTTCMNLKIIMLSKKRSSKKNILNDF